MAQQKSDVVARLLEEFDQPVFDLDVVIRAREAQAGGTLKRPLALGIEFANQILEIETGHAVCSFAGIDDRMESSGAAFVIGQ